MIRTPIITVLPTPSSQHQSCSNHNRLIQVVTLLVVGMFHVSIQLAPSVLLLCCSCYLSQVSANEMILSSTIRPSTKKSIRGQRKPATYDSTTELPSRKNSNNIRRGKDKEPETYSTIDAPTTTPITISLSSSNGKLDNDGGKSDNGNGNKGPSPNIINNNRTKKDKAVGKRSIPLASFTIDIQLNKDELNTDKEIIEEELEYVLTEYLNNAMNIEIGTEIIELVGTNVSDFYDPIQQFDFDTNVLSNETSSLDTTTSIEQSLLLLRQENALIDSPSELQAVINSIYSTDDSGNNNSSNIDDNSNSTLPTNATTSGSILQIVGVNISDTVLRSTDDDNDNGDYINSDSNNSTTPIQQVDQTQKEDSGPILYIILGAIIGVGVVLIVFCCIRQYNIKRRNKKDSYNHDILSQNSQVDAIIRTATTSSSSNNTVPENKKHKKQQYWATISHNKHSHHNKHHKNVINSTSERNNAIATSTSLNNAISYVHNNGRSS